MLLVFGRQGALGQRFAALGISFVDDLPGIIIAMLFVSMPFLVNGARGFRPDRPGAGAGGSHRRRQPLAGVFPHHAAAGVARGAGGGVDDVGARHQRVRRNRYPVLPPRTIPVLVYERFASFGLTAAEPVAVILIVSALLVFVGVQLLLRLRERGL